MASNVMRRVLVDYARQRKAAKRGGGASKESLEEERLVPDAYAEALLDLDDALKRFEVQYPR